MKNPRSKRDRDTTLRDLQTALQTLQNHLQPVSIAAVAREAHVTPALIHNKYPDFAEQIRRSLGRSMRARSQEKDRLLAAEREKCHALRVERDALLQELRDLASENESLRRELALQQAIAAGAVTRLPTRTAR